MDPKVRDLIQAALEKTQRGGLAWQSFDSNSFRAPAAGGYLHVQRGRFLLSAAGGEAVLRYAAQVTNPLGQVVAEADAVEGRNDDDFTALQGLFNAARTSALGGYQIIDSMLSFLRAG